MDIALNRGEFLMLSEKEARAKLEELCELARNDVKTACSKAHRMDFSRFPITTVLEFIFADELYDLGSFSGFDLWDSCDGCLVDREEFTYTQYLSVVLDERFDMDHCIWAFARICRQHENDAENIQMLVNLLKYGEKEEKLVSELNLIDIAFHNLLFRNEEIALLQDLYKYHCHYTKGDMRLFVKLSTYLLGEE